MAGLERHIHTTDAEEHARLAFRRDCPRCRVRLTGTLPPAAVVPAPVKASVVTGLMLAAGALPGASAMAEEPSPTTTAEVEPPEGAAPDDTEVEAPVDPPSEGGTDEVEAPPSSSPSDDGSDDVDPLVPLPQVESDSGDTGSGDSGSGGGSGDSGSGSSAPATESGSGESQSEASSGDEPRERDEREPDGGGDSAPSGDDAATALPGVGAASSDGAAGGEDRRGGDGKDDDRSPRGEGAGNGGRDAPQTSKEKHVVKRGDCLWVIARDALGDDASDAKVAAEVAKLWELNENEIGTGDPDLIHPGQELQLR